MAGAYTEIVEITAPGSAVAGDTVGIQVRIKNTHSATIGVMAAGEYVFGTSTKEVMTVVSGKLTVKLPGCKDWCEFGTFESFTVEANKKFQVKVESDTTYICRYYKDSCCGNCNCG